MAYFEIRDWVRGLKPGKRTPGIESAYGGLDRETLGNMYRVMVLARRIELEEKVLLRKGICRFFIGCGGKELIDVVTAQALKSDDPFIGYYRNKAFDLYRGVSIEQKILEAIGDRKSSSTGGMLQPSHSSYPEFGILPQASPTGSHALEAAGLGEAIKNRSPITGPIGIKGGRFKSDAIVFCSIGEGATSSPEFHRAVFYSVYSKTRNIYGIYNCGWAISTSVAEQFPEGNPTTSFEGFCRFGLLIENFDGTRIKESIAAVRRMIEHVKNGRGPVIANITVTREESHSGSDDQSHYMEPALQKYHIENDPLRNMASELIDDGLFMPEELAALYDTIDGEVKIASDRVCDAYQPKNRDDILGKVYSYNHDDARRKWSAILSERGAVRADRYREYFKKGYFETPELPENQPPMTLRKAVNYSLFDIFMLSDDTILFGEDVADFAREVFEKGEIVTGKLRGKGGVFLATKNLQRAFGIDRVFNTALDEAGILGRAVGHSYQGRIPIPEIQFIDYISPGYQQLKDIIATTYQRSNAKVRLPMVIRTSYGGYKQGAGSMWHSEANLGTFINIPGLQVVVPSNAADAAGLLRTTFVSGDPVLFCEAVALYNRREWDGFDIMSKYPPIDQLIPFGQAKVYNDSARDLAIITYGITVPIALRAAELLRENEINARVIDLRTVKPIDWKTIDESVTDCSKVLVVSEDRFHGGVGATIAAYIGDKLFGYLDGPVRLLTAEDCRVAYGAEGDEICLPQVGKIVSAVRELVAY
jgi:2-oxoisovalerate dehydrogenase E1 component